jgi:hypothetical protein
LNKEEKGAMGTKTMVGAGLLLAGVPAFLATSGHLFGCQVGREVDRFMQQTGSLQRPEFGPNELASLPEPVQRYFKHVLKADSEPISVARVRYTGGLRLSPSQGWLPIKADQYYTAREPGFLWYATVGAGPFYLISGRDQYIAGHGNMLIKIGSAVKVVDMVGTEIDVSSLARFVAEAPLLPTALRPSEWLQWQSRDVNSATAIVNHRGNTLSMDFFFDEAGEIVKTVTNDRYMADKNGYEQAPWVNYYRDYQEAAKGVLVPREGDAGWLLPGGRFEYARFKLTELQYNVPAKY